MTAILCPSNCDHVFEFPHTIITHSRIITEGGESVMERATFITCRECGHWLNFSGICHCPFMCHDLNGMVIVRKAVDAVD